MTMGIPPRLPVVLLAIVLLYWSRSLVAPLCFAGFVALALNPVVSRLTRVMPRGAAAAVVVVGALALGAGAAYSLADDASRAIEELPAAARQLRQTLQKSTTRPHGALTNIDRAIGELQRLWRASPSTGTPDLRRELLSWTAGSLGVGVQGVALLFLTYFLLATATSLKLKLVRLSGERLSRRKVTVQAIDEVTTQIVRFVVYLGVSSALVGVATWLAFRAMGVSYASLWGLASGVLNAVPYLGPTVVMMASGAAALVQFQSAGMAAAVAGVSMAITSLEGMIVSPILLGRMARVHPVVVFLSIVFWGWLWGPIGTFLAVPIVTTMKTIADLVPDGRTLSELLAAADTEVSARVPTMAEPAANVSAASPPG
ncbi:MAG: AI-2E family transporter [Acidobacteria bacterium]|nr:AI-2E family transporter [Acidobacteriota bacterium]